MRWRISNSMSFIRHFFFYLIASYRRQMLEMNVLFSLLCAIDYYFLSILLGWYRSAIIKYLSMQEPLDVDGHTAQCVWNTQETFMKNSVHV